MANYIIKLKVAGSRIDAVMARAKQAFSPDILLGVTKSDPAKSRADRLTQLEGDAADIVSGLEELRDEMQEWHDSIPENLQDGDKANEVQEAIEGLEELISNMGDIDFSSVSFPSMM